MAQATHAAFEAQRDIDALPATRPRLAAAGGLGLQLSIQNDLSQLEAEWRAFERVADCTVFQTFDWMSAWHRNIGVRNGTIPVIVVARDSVGDPLCMFPLAIQPGAVRRLTWLASELCDYNAPLLAPDFSRRFSAEKFLELWRDIAGRINSHPGMQYDLVDFEKMPEQVGAQRNPMLGLAVARNPSNAYQTGLTSDWEKFYSAKRSSATRRRDRTKRKRLGEFGEVAFVTPSNDTDVGVSFEILMQQKTLQFARMGVANLFAKPGYPEFYRDVAMRRRDLAHISRLDVGTLPAALNYGLMFRGCYYHVLASYTDHEMSKFGPGAAHLHELMAHAIANGCTTFDFTIGDERYKRDWCDAELKLYDHVTIVTARGAVVAGPLLALRGIKRWIKQTPAIWNAFVKLRSMAGALRGKPAEEKAAD